MFFAAQDLFLKEPSKGIAPSGDERSASGCPRVNMPCPSVPENAAMPCNKKKRNANRILTERFTPLFPSRRTSSEP
jgi:hypothetical protein